MGFSRVRRGKGESVAAELAAEGQVLGEQSADGSVTKLAGKFGEATPGWVARRLGLGWPG
jgi:hypothetical protein